MTVDAPAWPHAFGAPEATLRLREAPADFVVDEVLGFDPDGEGEHLLLRLEKTGANTAWAARCLARFAGLSPRDVSCSGLKDRHAVTRQWFSLHLPGRETPDFRDFAAEGLRVLECHRHGRKLRRGSHRANAFRITLRGAPTAAEARIAAIRQRGVPNYFGPQRYGRDLANLDGALAMFASPRRRLPREKRSLYLSAARSCIFDEVLSRRVVRDDWDALAAGDVAVLAGSASWFPVDTPDAALAARLAAFDIHPSGPLWGSGDCPSRDAVRRLEEAAAARYGTFRAGLEACGSRHERRALRLVPEDLVAEPLPDGIRLSFTLPAGAYATSVLREVAALEDASIART
jgi:tRNA pseudouridine13 synthase